MLEDNIIRYTVTMLDGHHIHLFVNLQTNLVVVDYAHKNEKGGNEILRRTLRPETDLAHCEKKKGKKS
jgi:hypothetical protein